MNHHYPPKPTRPGALFSYERNVREAIIRSRAGASAHARISDTTAGVFVNPAPVAKARAGQGTRAKRVTISSALAGDYLTCSDGTETILVALPYLFRRSIWNGRARDGFAYESPAGVYQSRTATHGLTGLTAVETIYHSYGIGDILFVEEADNTGIVGVTWIDMNSDGRAWVFDANRFNVCIGNTSKRVLVRSGVVST